MKFPISYILIHGFKGREFSIIEDDLSTLIIHDHKGPITIKDLEAADIRLQHQEKIDEIKKQYPTDKEKLEALWQSKILNDDQLLNECIKRIKDLDKQLKEFE